jgi:hypothetical protein
MRSRNGGQTRRLLPPSVSRKSLENVSAFLARYDFFVSAFLQRFILDVASLNRMLARRRGWGRELDFPRLYARVSYKRSAHGFLPFEHRLRIRQDAGRKTVQPRPDP